MPEPTAPGDRLPFLIILDKQGKEAGRFLLKDGENWVGIPVEEEDYNPTVDLEPYDTHNIISRRHAVIRKNGPDLSIEHAGKTNPTSINGVTLKIGKPVSLRDGDDVFFADKIHTRYVFEKLPPPEEDVPTIEEIR